MKKLKMTTQKLTFSEGCEKYLVSQGMRKAKKNGVTTAKPSSKSMLKTLATVLKILTSSSSAIARGIAIISISENLNPHNYKKSDEPKPAA